MNLGQQIKSLRTKRKLSQNELAEKAGISRVAIGNYERGDRSPTADIIVKLAQALEVSADTLLGLANRQNHLNRLANAIHYVFTAISESERYNSEIFLKNSFQDARDILNPTYVYDKIYYKAFFKLISHFKKLNEFDQIYAIYLIASRSSDIDTHRLIKYLKPKDLSSDVFNLLFKYGQLDDRGKITLKDTLERELLYSKKFGSNAQTAESIQPEK